MQLFGGVFAIIGKFLASFFTAEAVIQGGGADPAKEQAGSLGGRGVGLIGVWGYCDDPAVVAAVQAAALAAYPPNGQSKPAPVK